MRTVEGMTPQKASDILNDPSWTKGVFLRDPVDRLLSCFLDKIVHRKWDGALPPSETMTVGFCRGVGGGCRLYNRVHGQQLVAQCWMKYRLRPLMRYAMVSYVQLLSISVKTIAVQVTMAAYVRLNSRIFYILNMTIRSGFDSWKGRHVAEGKASSLSFMSIRM